MTEAPDYTLFATPARRAGRAARGTGFGGWLVALPEGEPHPVPDEYGKYSAATKNCISTYRNYVKYGDIPPRSIVFRTFGGKVWACRLKQEDIK